MSVSEYVTTNVKAKPVKSLHETNDGYLCYLTCAALILLLLQENNLSNSIPHRVKCRTKAVNHLLWSLET